MKQLAVRCAVLLACAAPLTSFAATGHGDHGSMDMGHGGHQGDIAHQEVVDGVKVAFKVMSMKEHMKGLNMEMPKGMRETHHIAVEFKDARSGKALTEGIVRVKVLAPDKATLTKDLVGMQGHFGADFNLSAKGTYGVMCKFQLKDGKVRSSKFWYTVR